jgi:hypothetical protein
MIKTDNASSGKIKQYPSFEKIFWQIQMWLTALPYSNVTRFKNRNQHFTELLQL